MIKQVNEKFMKSKKVAFFVALVLLLSSVFSLVSIDTAYAASQIHVFNVPSDAASVSVNYLGDYRACEKSGGVWKVDDDHIYVKAGILGIKINGSTYIPRSALVFGTEGEGTIKVTIPDLASYTIKHEYYTITNGVAALDDTDSSTITGYVGQEIDLSDIDREEKGYYDYKSITPSSDPTLTAAGLTITLRYERVAAPYTVKHEYYTQVNGGAYSKDDTVTNTVTGYAGQWINPWDNIPKVENHDGHHYDFHALSPIYPQVLGLYDVSYTLVYRRSICTANVNVIHKYYTITDGVSNYDGQDTNSFTGVVGETVNIGGIAKDNTYSGNTYDYKSITPSSDFPLGAGGATVTLTYERIRTTGTYNIVHEYYLSVDGGAPVIENSVSGGTGSGFVGTTLNLGGITKVYSNNSKTYSFSSFDPATNPPIVNGMTVKLKYIRYLTTSGYTVVHQYYTSTDGGIFNIDDTFTEHFAGYVNDVVNASSIAQRTTNDGKSYTFISTLPPSVTLDADGETFYVTYHRSLSSYRIVHEYYTSTNGGGYSLDGTDASPVYYGYVSDVIDLSGITKDNTLGSDSYTFDRFDPTTNPSLSISGGLEIKLIYERELATYTVAHSYATSMNGALPTPDGSATPVTITGYVGTPVNLSAITQIPSFGGNDYTFMGYDPTTNPAIAADGSLAITLNYQRSLANYTIVHSYATSLNGAAATPDGSESMPVLTDYAGTTIDMSTIAKDTNYLGNDYTFTGFDPATNPSVALDGSLVITLSYERNLANYTIVHSYSTSMNGAAAISDGTETMPTLTGYVGTTIDMDTITKDTSYLGNDYTFVDFDPAADPAIASDGSLIITLNYERNLANYTIVHSYSTSIDGAAATPDGTETMPVLTDYVGTTINMAAIAKDTNYLGNDYTFTGFDPAADPAIASDGSLVITLNYQRNLSTYSIVHEYYTSTNGGAYVLDHTSAAIPLNGYVGSSVDLGAITQVPGYNGNTYTFASYDPAANPTLSAEGGLVVTLNYQRSITVYKITTAATNGTITQTQENILGGSQRTITYTPFAGFHLASLTVDGQPINIVQYPTEYTFMEISSDHNIAAVFEANPTTGTLSISKVIAGTTTPLAGAVFNIYGDSALSSIKYANVTTNASGIATITDMLPGNYWVKEMTPPTGYEVLAGAVQVEITVGETTSIVIPNTAELGFGTGELKIVKTDASSGKALANAKFSIYSDSALKTLVQSGLSTNSAGVILVEALDPATYYVVETAAPSGYQKISGKLAAVVVADQTTVLNIKNSKTEEQDYQTGTDDYNMLIAGGALLLIGLMLLILYMRKRQRA